MLSDEDISTIGRLLDQRLSQAEARARRRRLWFWLSLFALSAISGWYAVRQFRVLYDGVQHQLGEAQVEMREAKLAYQRELARNAELRSEHDRAANLFAG